MKNLGLIFILLVLVACENSAKTGAKNSVKKEKLKALIVDGQNNHGIWPKTTVMMQDYLLETNMFDVEVQRTSNTWQGPHSDPPFGVDSLPQLMGLYKVEGMKKNKAVEVPEIDTSFSPNWTDYDVVISNLGWKTAPWTEQTKKSFETYMKNGGGLVIVHAANNAWPDWHEYNKMIGIGGWSDRNTIKHGPQIYFDEEGKQQAQTEESSCGSHGPQMEYIIENRAPSHPIMKDIPDEWLHTKDELYERLCGPAENITVLATAFADAEGNSPPWNKEIKGSDRSEPVLLCVDYGKGRTFHSTIGHADYSMECVGFITTFLRGCEWAATGEVSIALPEDFPGKDDSSSRDYGAGAGYLGDDSRG